MRPAPQNPPPGNPPSSLAVVILQLSQAFSAVGDATPILVGAHYLENRGAGSDARVLFVPERGQGSVSGDLIDMGKTASMVHSCDVYVRAAETQDDITRFVAAYALADKVIDFLQTAATGRISWGALIDDSPVTAPSGFGAGLKFSFTYQRAIPHDPARWALPAPTAGTDAAVPVVPPINVGLGHQPALPGSVDTVTPTTVPKEDT